MQKIINVLAVASGVVSAAVVASGVFVYSIKSQAIEAIGGSLGGGLGGDLPVGTPELAPPADSAAVVPSAGLGISQF